MLGIIRNISAEHLNGVGIYNLVLETLPRISAVDTQFKSDLENNGMYDTNPRTTRYILISLERQLDGESIFNKANPDSLDDYLENAKPRWTIEHILPEGPLPDYWKEAISPDDQDDAQRIQEGYCHMVGNLTLTPYNANLGKLPFFDPSDNADDSSTYKHSKRDYKDNGQLVGLRLGLKLNRGIPNGATHEIIADKTSWTIEDIQRRTKQLAEEILKLYSFPAKEA